MTNLWIPDVPRVPAWWAGEPYGEPSRVVWHTLEREPDAHPRIVADYLNRICETTHVVWNPFTGEIVQMAPAGLVTVIGVIAHAADPFTSSPCVGLDALVAWFRHMDIPEVWPAGPPLTPDVDGNRDMAAWQSQAGHYASSQIPEGRSNGPGAIDIRRLFGAKADRADQRGGSDAARSTTRRGISTPVS